MLCLDEIVDNNQPSARVHRKKAWATRGKMPLAQHSMRRQRRSLAQVFIWGQVSLIQL
jgi:hypothetical protein